MAHALDIRCVHVCRELGIYGTAKALLAAPASHELDILKPLIGPYVTFSLYGKYGANHVTCDVCDLSPFEPGSFDFFEACLLFDYVPETAVAIGNIARVLKNRAAFFIHISEGRLLPGDQAPRLHRYRSDWTASYYPKEYQQPIMKIGRKWFALEWARYGFSVDEIIWNDPIISKPVTWWIGWRCPHSA
jgi:hypothetical protein